MKRIIGNLFLGKLLAFSIGKNHFLSPEGNSVVYSGY